MIRAVIYARVSTSQQEEDGTIDSQLDAIKNHPTIRGMEVLDVYADNGVSGYSKALWDRPEGKRLLKDAEEGRLQGCELLLTRLNRLGRRAREVDEAIDRLMEHGVTVVSVKEGYRFDNQTPMGIFTRQLFASLAELDRNTIVDTTRDGLVRKAREGRLMPTHIRLGYGWSEVRDGHKAPGAKMLVDQHEAELVRLIFNRIPTMSTTSLRNWLNTEGYRLPCKLPKRRETYQRTERLFSNRALQDIAKDELYTGMVIWGKTARSKDYQPEEFRHHFPDLQIVSFEAFNQVQTVLKERRTVPPKSQGSPYVFSGLLRCPRCGGRTVGTRQLTGREVNRYRCGSHHREGITACRGWVIREHAVKRAILPFLVDLLEEKLHWSKGLQDATQELQREQAGEKAQALDAELIKLRVDLSKVQEGYLAEVFSAEEARGKSLDIRERIERLESRRANLEAAGDIKKRLAAGLRLLEKPLIEFLGELPPMSLQRLCRMVFQSVTVKTFEKTVGSNNRRVEVGAYEFTPAMKQALADSAHIEPITTGLQPVPPISQGGKQTNRYRRG